MDAIWDCSMTFIRLIANRDAWLMARRAWTSTLSWPGSRRACLSRSISTAAFGTDLDIILREWGVDTVIVSGRPPRIAATPRRGMYDVSQLPGRLSVDATATYDYPDRGFWRYASADVHHATLVILAASTAHVMSVKDIEGCDY